MREFRISERDPFFDHEILNLIRLKKINIRKSRRVRIGVLNVFLQRSKQLEAQTKARLISKNENLLLTI